MLFKFAFAENIYFSVLPLFFRLNTFSLWQSRSYIATV